MPQKVMDSEARSRFAATIRRLPALTHPRVQAKHLARAIWDVRGYDPEAIRSLFERLSPQADPKIGCGEFEQAFKAMKKRHSKESRRRWWRKKYLQMELDALGRGTSFVHDIAEMIRYVKTPVFERIGISQRTDYRVLWFWIELIDVEHNRWRCVEEGDWYSKYNIWNATELATTDALQRRWKQWRLDLPSLHECFDEHGLQWRPLDDADR